MTFGVGTAHPCWTVFHSYPTTPGRVADGVNPVPVNQGSSKLDGLTEKPRGASPFDSVWPPTYRFPSSSHSGRPTTPKESVLSPRSATGSLFDRYSTRVRSPSS